VLLVESSDGVVVVGPSGTPPPVFRVDPRLIVRDLAEASKLDPLDARRRLTSVWERVRGAAGLTGLRKVGLFSTHYLSARVPRLAEWRELERVGKEAAARRTVLDRLSALGFEYEQRGEGIYVLRAENRPAAAVLSYPASRDLDRASAGGELPVATLLREMEAAGVDWGVLVSGELWRIYSAQHPARMTSFVELDLARLNEPGYFAALFSATALRRGGLAERIGEGSRDFAVGLGDRLRDRTYERVVPSIARSVADELDRLGERPEAREQLDAVYQATLVLLYRLLFVLYAESREYLPVNASAGYRDHSLRQRIDSLRRSSRAASSPPKPQTSGAISPRPSQRSRAGRRVGRAPIQRRTVRGRPTHSGRQRASACPAAQRAPWPGALSPRGRCRECGERADRILRPRHPSPR